MNSFPASWIPFYRPFSLRLGTEKTVDPDKPQIAQISEMTEAKGIVVPPQKSVRYK